MSSIFEQPEPDILVQYYDKGEGFWEKVGRFIGNFLRRFSGDELLDCDERNEFDELEEGGFFSDK